MKRYLLLLLLSFLFNNIYALSEAIRTYRDFSKDGVDYMIISDDECKVSYYTHYYSYSYTNVKLSNGTTIKRIDKVISNTYESSYGDYVVIPEEVEYKDKLYKVTSIDDNAFAFNNSKIDTLIVLSKYISGTSLPKYKANNIITYYTELLKYTGNANVVPLESYVVHNVTSYTKGFDFEVAKISDKLNFNIDLESSLMSKITVTVNGEEKDVTLSRNNFYEIRNLAPNTTYNVKVYFQLVDENGVAMDQCHDTTISTLPIEISSEVENTQASIKIYSIKASDDKTAKLKKVWFTTAHDGYIKHNDGYTVTGLEPLTKHTIWSNTGEKTIYDSGEYNVNLYAEYEDGETVSHQIKVYTLSLNPYISLLKSYPTKLILKGKYDAGDAEIETTSIAVNGKWIEGDEICATDILPKTSVMVDYSIKTKGGSTYLKTSYFTTPTVTLTTQPAKTVKSGEVIVAAKTNLPDDEAKVGFEWRKADAPEDLPSLKGSGAIYQDMLEAKIQNLSTSSFYRVRPYFEDAKGTMYYGEWIAFDPSEFSYCEPAVHTYADAKVSAESVMLTGYVIAGTDDILEQGFEYWKVSGNKGNVAKITATGQRMTAIITNTEYNSSYKYRAYIKTSKGTTYGEEQTFSIGDVNGGSETPQTIQKEISLSLAGYATFYNENTSFLLPNGLSAQVITTSNSGKLAYTTIANGDANGIIPKGVPVILVSNNRTGGTYTLTSTTESASYSGSNLLHGSNTQTMTSNVNGVSTYGNSSYVYYKLAYGKSGSVNANKLGWYWGANNGAAFTIAGGKAWLALPKSSAQSLDAILLEEDDATSIDGIEQSYMNEANDAQYNMAGQRVGNGYNGIIIENGKKVIR